MEQAQCFSGAYGSVKGAGAATNSVLDRGSQQSVTWLALNLISLLRGRFVKNIDDVLKEKEAQIQQTKMEIEALRMVVPLLADSGEEFERSNEEARRTGT